MYDSKQEPAGFEVVYEYQGHQHHVHMSKEPGGTLPVKDGTVVLASLQKAPGTTTDP